MLGRLADRTCAARFGCTPRSRPAWPCSASSPPWRLPARPRRFVELRDAVGPLAWALPFVLVGRPSFLMGGTLPALLRALRPDADAVAPATGLLYAANTAGAVAGTLADAVPARPRFRHPGHGLLRRGARPRCRGRRARPRSACVRPPRRCRPHRDRNVPPERHPRRTLRPRPLRRGRRRRARLRGRLVRAARPVPEHAELRVRGDAGHVPVGPRPRQLPLRALLAAAAAIRGGRFGVLLAAPARAPSASSRCWAPGCPTPRPSPACGRCAHGARDHRSGRPGSRWPRPPCCSCPRRSSVRRFRPPPGWSRAQTASAATSGDRRAINTAGGIAGTLLTGFVLVPRLGLVRSLGVLARPAPCSARSRCCRARRGRRVAAAAFVCAAGLLAWRSRRATSCATLLAEKRGGTLVFYAEDTGGTVAVLEQRPPAGVSSAGSTSRASRTPATR